MPRGYEVMRDKIYQEELKRGTPPDKALKGAKELAAKIWNSKHKGRDAVYPGRKD